MRYPKTHTNTTTTKQILFVSRTCSGGHSERETPGPIPNPEVKPPSADGTAHASVWESKTPPDNTPRAPTTPTGCGGTTTPPPKTTTQRPLRFHPDPCQGIGRSSIMRNDSRETELLGRGSALHPPWLMNQLNRL